MTHISKFLARIACALGLAATWVTAAAADENLTVETSSAVLHEIMGIPARQIPESMLADAHGVAVIPSVIKIGFVAGVRFGHGVLLARGADGRWTLPTFITLTGGSVGWQAGAQATDVILVMRSRKSVDALLRGRFTLGADAAVAAGPVGRSIEAATDATLQAEIYSYSRSRGLFAGAALDGTIIQVDSAAHMSFYGSAPNELPARVPDSATRLVEFVARLTSPSGEAAANAPPSSVPPPAGGFAPASSTPSDALRAQLVASSQQLQAIVDDNWKQYLALPLETIGGPAPPNVPALQAAEQRFRAVAGDARYQALTGRAEFRATSDLLSRYIAALTPPNQPSVNLPPPPAGWSPPSSNPLPPQSARP